MFIKLIGIEFADQYFGKKQHSANKKHNSNSVKFPGPTEFRKAK